MKLLQMDFKSQGPWGDEMSNAFTELAEDIATEEGLIWKIWTESKENGEGGGIYLFESHETAQAYLEKHSARLANFGVSEINAKEFDVNVPLTKIDRGYLGDK